MGKVALVTGSNKGIGKEIVRQLADRGFEVILSTRFAVKGILAKELMYEDHPEIDFKQLDVSDEYSIKEAFKQIKEKYGRIDVLINNAGILVDGRESILDISTSKIFQTMHTNALGALMVSRIMLPLMPDGGRIIMISSGGGSICDGPSYWAPIYCISKTTLNAITIQLAESLRERNIAVNAVCPGWVQTDMGGRAAERKVSKGAETPVWLATEADQEITGKFFRDKTEINW